MLGIKWHWGSKDGGAESHVWAYGFECKALFSVLLLRFEEGSRDAYHNHAFNAVSWILRGDLREIVDRGSRQPYLRFHYAGRRAITTLRTTTHKVISLGRTWVLSLRGPWSDTWQEKTAGGVVTLTHGRRNVSASN